MTTGTKIKYLRKMKGLKQEDLAQHISITQQAYSRMETETTQPTYDQLRRIVDLLGVSVEDFDKWDGKFVFNNYGNPSTANGQVHHHKSLSDEEKELYRQLLAQKEQETQRLADENSYLKTLIDKILPPSTGSTAA